MIKIRCVIIEDEPLAMERVKGYVQKLPFLQLEQAFDNALEAIDFLQHHPIDLLFLDINLGDFSGIQLLESTKPSCQVILTTAYQEYALKGYELKIADYLLKPFTLERFVQAVGRVQELLNKAETPVNKEFIFVKTEYRLEKIFLNDILFIEGMGDYRRIHTPTKKIMTLQTFGELEKEIPPSLICRVHKSYMVAIAKIDAIEKDRISIGKTLIPVSDSYRERFYALIR
ncbi:MAG: LytTR family DNA-binding domain-containing protein [Spirosomaceae bacterium]|jgi:two-component system, LytTR family, response regulator|nr:LytTR family DNA-binding domain-containing protein [Spirosomataceae bacterium]